MKKRTLRSKLSASLHINLSKVLLENPRILDDMIALLMEEIKDELREEYLNSERTIIEISAKKKPSLPGVDEDEELESAEGSPKSKKGAKKSTLRGWNYH